MKTWAKVLAMVFGVVGAVSADIIIESGGVSEGTTMTGATNNAAVHTNGSGALTTNTEFIFGGGGTWTGAGSGFRIGPFADTITTGVGVFNIYGDANQNAMNVSTTATIGAGMTVALQVQGDGDIAFHTLGPTGIPSIIKGDSGYFGIGTQAPTERLSVWGIGGTYVASFSSSTTGTPIAFAVENDNDVVGTINVETSGMTLTTVEKMYFASAGCNNATAATMWDLPTSNAPAAACRTGTNTQKGVLDFDQDTDESAYVSFLLASDSTGTVDARIVWSSTTTETNSVVWDVATICSADDESDDPAFNTGSPVTDAYGGTSASKTMVASVTGVTITGCAAGEFMYVRVSRDANNGSDTLTGDARLIGVELTLRQAQ